MSKFFEKKVPVQEVALKSTSLKTNFLFVRAKEYVASPENKPAKSQNNTVQNLTQSGKNLGVTSDSEEEVSATEESFESLPSDDAPVDDLGTRE